MNAELDQTELRQENLADAEKKAKARSSGGGDAVYAVGMIGAWVYYIGHASSVQEGVLGFFKGLVWPALLVHKSLSMFDKE